LRAHDSLGRWGGEEFLVLLVHTDLAGGRVVAENLRRRVEEHTFLGGRLGKSLTVSIGGVALEPPAQWELPDVVDAADGCLYEAKANGRNCSVFKEQ
jgi:diguanylate cyclase (GGDEF)-like protein